MKKFQFKTILLLVISVLIFNSCTEEEQPIPSMNKAISGTWQICQEYKYNMTYGSNLTNTICGGDTITFFGDGSLTTESAAGTTSGRYTITGNSIAYNFGTGYKNSLFKVNNNRIYLYDLSIENEDQIESGMVLKRITIIEDILDPSIEDLLDSLLNSLNLPDTITIDGNTGNGTGTNSGTGTNTGGNTNPNQSYIGSWKNIDILQNDGNSIGTDNSELTLNSDGTFTRNIEGYLSTGTFTVNSNKLTLDFDPITLPDGTPFSMVYNFTFEVNSNDELILKEEFDDFGFQTNIFTRQ